mmetsp:Transcript_20944/g.45376  ORF Transcript_20944/g.45376 Transcript_20944/m.45376 type:complete len:223 (+) Transcript_20944:678-1346(+)
MALVVDLEKSLEVDLELMCPPHAEVNLSPSGLCRCDDVLCMFHGVRQPMPTTRVKRLPLFHGVDALPGAVAEPTGHSGNQRLLSREKLHDAGLQHRVKASNVGAFVEGEEGCAEEVLVLLLEGSSQATDIGLSERQELENSVEWLAGGSAAVDVADRLSEIGSSLKEGRVQPMSDRLQNATFPWVLGMEEIDEVGNENSTESCVRNGRTTEKNALVHFVRRR